MRDLIISLRVLLHVCYCSQYDVCALTLLYSGLTSGMTLPHWVAAVVASLFLYLVCTLVLHCMLVFLCARLCTGYLRGRVHARASAYIPPQDGGRKIAAPLCVAGAALTGWLQS